MTHMKTLGWLFITQHATQTQVIDLCDGDKDIVTTGDQGTRPLQCAKEGNLTHPPKLSSIDTCSSSGNCTAIVTFVEWCQHGAKHIWFAYRRRTKEEDIECMPSCVCTWCSVHSAVKGVLLLEDSRLMRCKVNTRRHLNNTNNITAWMSGVEVHCFRVCLCWDKKFVTCVWLAASLHISCSSDPCLFLGYLLYSD